jgi:PHP family Zn ribbon phosphoesterase
VEQRVEELADRPADFKRANAPGFIRLLPLSEIIAAVIGSESPSTQAVWKNYNLLIEKFGDEYTTLIDAPLEALVKVVDAPIAQEIVKVRNGEAKVTPGYDGVYGQLVLDVDTPKKRSKPPVATVKQLNMNDFW